jgi:hypothetical protein
MRDAMEFTDLKSLKDLFFKLISASQGQASSTRLLYLVSGLAAVFSALVMTMGGVIEYCVHHDADAVYWGAVATLWTAKLGFSAYEKNEQQKHAVERQRQTHNPGMAEPAMASGD